MATPILLLKTKSSPADAYQELFSAAPSHGSGGRAFDASFVPVLRHSFDDEGTARVRALLGQRAIGPGPGCSYGGLVFTSQRAVEAFAKVVEDARDGRPGWRQLEGVPTYSVGPATTRALGAIRQSPPLQVFGEHTGNGSALARFMLQHYRQWYGDRREAPPLLFLVGEQRRDMIARTLMDPSLPAEDRIRVDELVVYGTGVMESFPQDFAAALQATRGAPSRWVVVFSPTGCDGMLRGLGLLDEATGKAASQAAGEAGEGCGDGATYVATIGPTTWTHLAETFGFHAHVCAETPSPEGVLGAITDFESTRGTIGV